MRIIAGEYKSRRLQSPPPDLDVRPITDRVKESVFSLLRGHCDGARIMDLFAGTGAVGLEALSRGASHCVFVERDRRAAAILKKNIETLGPSAAERSEVVVGDALGPSTAARCPRPATFIFMDPPYPLVEDPVGLRRVLAQVGALVPHLADDGYLLLRTPWPLAHKGAEDGESPTAPAVHAAPDLRVAGVLGPETHRYGSMAVHFYMKPPARPPANNPPGAPPAHAPAPPMTPVILFTAFEPSGDDHAAAVIAELRRRRPDLPIHAWGGPRMKRAGATIVEATGDDAVMGMPGLQKIREHSKMNDRIAEWVRQNPIRVHVPVDSPGANFPICAITRSAGARVVHLVAPQIWAWGRWRIHKLRRRTDLVLCLLPFEQSFFRERHVNAKFIGHPLFDEPVDEAALDARAQALAAGGGGGSPRIALMPGSRPAELERNFPLLLDAFRSLRDSYPGLSGVVAATKPAVAERLRSMAESASGGGWPEQLGMAVADTDAVIRWCDLALVVSGTVTLQIARQLKPMVVVYRSSPLFYYGFAKWVLATKYFALPNVLAHNREIVPEFAPHFGGSEKIVRAARMLLDSPERFAEARAELARVVGQFQGRNAAAAAADAIEEVAGLLPARPDAAPDLSPPRAAERRTLS